MASSIDEVHSVGGLHPEWRIDHYEEIYRAMKKEFPHISLKSLTAVEVKHIGKRSGLSIDDTLTRLRDAGLDALPGGGAEILVDTVRDGSAGGRSRGEEYLSIHRTAHKLGIPTNCTMLFGTVETLDDRITHLDLLRRLQDETRVPVLRSIPIPTGPHKATRGRDTIRTRGHPNHRNFKDNVGQHTPPQGLQNEHGDHLASIGILSGADDIDGTVQQEEIMHAAGSTTPQNTGLEGLVSSSNRPVRSQFRETRRTPTSNNAT